MAKELPYFKFEPNQWENGNIQICSREDKGLFLDLCSMYWSRLGNLPLKLAIQKLCAGNATAFDSLVREEIFEVIDGMICINFLNEQLQEFTDTSKQNSKNAREGWEKRRKNKALSEINATASNTQSETDAIREEKKREEERKRENIKKEKSNFIFNELLISQEWINLTAMQSANKYSEAQVKNLLKKYNDKINASFDFKEDRKEYCKHFINWLNVQPKQNGPTSNRIRS